MIQCARGRQSKALTLYRSSCVRIIHGGSHRNQVRCASAENLLSRKSCQCYSLQEGDDPFHDEATTSRKKKISSQLSFNRYPISFKRVHSHLVQGVCACVNKLLPGSKNVSHLCKKACLQCRSTIFDGLIQKLTVGTPPIEEEGCGTLKREKV